MHKKNVATVLKNYGVRSMIAKVTHTPKRKFEKAYGCTEGCRRRFISPRALNIHLNKVHNAKYKIQIDARCRAYSVTKSRVKVA